ncbi:MAG TPA: SDR family NAD(P)-dependent oxidoreductase [Methyloceanibacter sp.]|nr:SDR family NAD(P)-dependent oxidoreductase [Methyloceanibacter sp.]
MRPRVVLITGASSGIGEATSKLYAARGAHVLLLARDAERLGEVAEAIRAAGGKSTPYVVDLAEAPAIAETAARIERECGTPDILINNAGAGRWLPLLGTSPEEARAMMAVPYFAAFDLTRAFTPGMIARGSGRIVFISSPAAYIAWPRASAYIAARRAMTGLADSLRGELKGKGIGVTLVILGTVETPYWEHNPGSRENMPQANPRLFPVLTSEQAAEAIVTGAEARKALVVKPALYRALFILNALFPRLVESQLRRSMPKPRS